MNYCINCLWISGRASVFASCKHDANLAVSLVTGEPEPKQSIGFCRGAQGHCGAEGKHFEAASAQLLRDEYPDKCAGLKADAIRTQGDTK